MPATVLLFHGGDSRPILCYSGKPNFYGCGVNDRTQGGSMPEHLENKPRHAFTASLVAGLMCAVAPALAQQSSPDFSAGNVGWISVGGEWTPLPGSPPPVTQDPSYKYVPNNVGGQPTFRIANLNNPNLTQFAKDSLKKANEDVLAGKPMWSRSSRC